MLLPDVNVLIAAHRAAAPRHEDARGDLVSDAVIAALAMEAGATVVTYDRDFARFPDVRWCTPGESA